MRKIRKAAVIIGLLINLFCMTVPSTAASSSSAYKNYVQKNMITSLGKASTGTKTGSGQFEWCSNRGVLGTYVADFNGDGKGEAVVLYLKKDSSSSRTNAHLAVLSLKNGKVIETQDISAECIDWGIGTDFRVYIKAHSGKKYVVIQAAGAIDDSMCEIFVLGMNKNGRFSGTGFHGETFEGGYEVQLNRFPVSSSTSSLLSFDYSSGTVLLSTRGDMTGKKYGQLLKKGLKKYGLSLGLTKVSYGTKMWSLKKNSGMTLLGSVQTLNYNYSRNTRTTKYQGKSNFKNTSSASGANKTVKIKLNKTSATLYLNGSKTVKLKASVTGSKKKVSWSSSNKKVAAVDSSGKVTAKKVGKAVITAKVDKKTAKCTITVKKSSGKKNNSKQENKIVIYEDILNEYRRAISENFSDEDGYAYIPGYLRPDVGYHQGGRIFYTYYDFMNDGLPELIISEYFEGNGKGDSEYVIRDAYGTDGEIVQKLCNGYEKGFTNTYYFCKNNVLGIAWASGGFSAGGEIFFQLYPNRAAGEKIEEIEHNGSGECWKYDPEDPENEQIWIQPSEYEQIRDSYPEIEIPFEWQEIIG